VTPARLRESSWVSRDCRTVEARAYPIRTCPAGSAPATTGRGNSTQTEPGRRTAGVATSSALANDGTSRNRAVWYWTATFPLPVRHGDPAGARQDDIGQSLVSTRSVDFRVRLHYSLVEARARRGTRPRDGRAVRG
jgi:hypothetical protein